MNDWKDNLNTFFSEDETVSDQDNRSEIEIFIADLAAPAFAELTPELESHGRTVTVRISETSAAIIINRDGEEELSYRIQSRTFPNGVLPYAEVRYRQRGGLKLLTAESMFRTGNDYSISDITKEEIIAHFVKNYTTRAKQG